MSDKKSRKDLLKQQDAFISAANQGAQWVFGHRILVTGAACALVLGIAGTWGFIEYTASRDSGASVLYGQALAILDAQIVSGEGQTADPKALPPTFASEEERRKAARDAFQKVADESASSGVSDLARFYVADLDAKAGDSDKALSEFGALRDDLSGEDNLFFLAAERTAYLLEDKGDKDGAINAWQQLAGGANRFYADHALYQLARLHQIKGDSQKARELLDRFEQDFAQSPLRPQVEELSALVGRDEVKPKAEAARAPGVPEGDTEKKATP